MNLDALATPRYTHSIKFRNGTQICTANVSSAIYHAVRKDVSRLSAHYHPNKGRNDLVRDKLVKKSKILPKHFSPNTLVVLNDMSHNGISKELISEINSSWEK